jgi:hypothetical protein
MTFKEVSPRCMRVVHAQPTCTHGKKIIFPHAHVTIPKTAYIHPQLSKKKMKMQELTLHPFVILEDVCALERVGA